MNFKKIAYISIGLNALVSVFFIGKRCVFQKDLRARMRHHSYLDNPQYIEQVDIQSTYTMSANAVIFGDSHVYKCQWNELLNRPDIATRGIGSDITSGFMARISQVIAVHPKICFIEAGANDLWYGMPTDTIGLHLQKIIDTLRSCGIGSVIHLLPCMAKNAEDVDTYNNRLHDLNNVILKLSKSEGIECIDLYSLFSKDGYLNPQFAQADGVHLKGSAYLLWANEIRRILKEDGI